MIELEVTEKMFGPMAVAASSPWFRPVCSLVILNEFLSDTCQPTHLLESMPSTIHTRHGILMHFASEEMF